jgi:hypothetical protein
MAMRLIQEFGYTVKVGKDEAHQKWLTDNDAALKAAMPAGHSYIGTFAVVLSSEKHAGSYKTLIGIDSYGAMDVGAAAAKDPNTAYGKLLRDASQFYDLDLVAPWSNTLMKDVLDATIWDPKG